MTSIRAKMDAAAKVARLGAVVIVGLAAAGCLWEASPESSSSEKVVYSENTGLSAATRSAEQHCNRFARQSVLVKQPPETASYVFYCY